MAHMETPRWQGAAVSGTVQAAKLDNRIHNTARLQRQAIALHQLGPRPLAEFICEIIAAHPELQARVDAYASLAPAVVVAVSADRFPPQVFEVRR